MIVTSKAWDKDSTLKSDLPQILTMEIAISSSLQLRIGLLY